MTIKVTHLFALPLVLFSIGFLALGARAAVFQSISIDESGPASEPALVESIPTPHVFVAPVPAATPAPDLSSLTQVEIPSQTDFHPTDLDQAPVITGSDSEPRVPTSSEAVVTDDSAQSPLITVEGNSVLSQDSQPANVDPKPASIVNPIVKPNVFVLPAPEATATSTNPSSFTVEGASPYYALKKSLVGQEWRVRAGGSSQFGSSFDIFNQTSNRSALTIGTEGNVSIGTPTINTNSRLYVYGGPTGANIDVRGDASIVGGDQATIELEGNDYDTEPNSALLQYFGSRSVGSTMGFPNNRLGLMSFAGANVGIIRMTNAAPLVFGTDNFERMRISGNGNIGIGTINPQTKLHISAGPNATTTITIGELNVTSSKTCVNMNRSDGGPASFYISPAGAIVVSTSYCQ